MIALFGKHPLIVGFVLGYAPPLYYAVDGIRHELTSVASLPPNTPICGMGMLWAWIMILCIGPARARSARPSVMPAADILRKRSHSNRHEGNPGFHPNGTNLRELVSLSLAACSAVATRKAEPAGGGFARLM